MNPEEVKDFQRKLAAQNLYTGKIDGVMGPETKAAIELLRTREDRAADQERQRQKSESEARAAESEARAAEARADEVEMNTQREAEQRAPENQAIEAAKFAIPMAGGMYMGHKTAEGTERRIGKMSQDAQRNMSVGRRFSPYFARSATRFFPEAGAAFYGSQQFKNPVAQESLSALGTGLLSAGLVNTGEGLVKSLTAPDIPGGPPSAPQSTPPAAPQTRRPALPQSAIPQNRDTLVEAARVAGAKGKLNKAQAVKYLKKNITPQNRADIARALRVNSGPNFDQRITKKIGALASTMKRLPSLAGPLVAGAVAYDLASGDAEASDLGPRDQAARGLAAGGVGAATYEGGRRLSNMLSRVAPTAMRALGGGMAMTMPMAIADEFEPDYTEDERLSGSNRLNNTMARFQGDTLGMPEQTMGRNVAAAHQMAQVPERNPRSLPEGADPDVAKAWRQSPRRTIIELTRQSGLDAADIAMLAGADAEEVQAVMGQIPQQALEMRASP